MYAEGKQFYQKQDNERQEAFNFAPRSLREREKLAMYYNKGRLSLAEPPLSRNSPQDCF